MKVLLSLFTAVLTLNAAPAKPQDTKPSIDLGGFSVSLGMQQDDVLRKLAVIYELRSMNDGPGSWIVVRKGGPPYQVIGTIGFRNDRLTFASRSWVPNGREPAADELARALRNAFASLIANGHSLCAVSTTTSSTGSDTTFECGRHTLSVFAPESGSNVAVGINESINESPQ
jgi:hypothetical protein